MTHPSECLASGHWHTQACKLEIPISVNEYLKNNLLNLGGWVWQQNRPINTQMVADALQKHGIKKTSAQKVMDSLAADGKISFKDYGKQRVYVANQAQFDIPDIDELDAMKKQNQQLQADVTDVRVQVSALEAGS